MEEGKKHLTESRIDSLNDAFTEDAVSTTLSTNDRHSLYNDDSSISDSSSDADSCSTIFEDCLDDIFYDALASPECNSEMHCMKTAVAWKPSGKQFPMRMQSVLAVSETSWSAQQRSDLGDKNMSRMVRSILNKITAESFDKLYAQIVANDFEENELITTLVTEVFEKATRQHSFIPVYAELCSRLHATFLERHGVGKGKLFKRTLLCRCQDAFRKAAEGSEDFTYLRADEQEEAETNHRIFILGVFKFIGALLAKGLLASCILPSIIDEMLEVDHRQLPKPRSLELLIVLLTSVGSKMDVPTWAYHQHFCECFIELEKLQRDVRLPNRTRCLLQNILDFRAAGWH